MLDQGIRDLAGENSSEAAGDAIFRNFNLTHGGGEVGYSAGEKIGIKLNLNNAYYVDENLVRQDNEAVDITPRLVYALDVAY